MQAIKFFLFLVLTTCQGQTAPLVKDTSGINQTLGHAVTELDSVIWSIYQDKAGTHWFGSRENGLYRYSNKELLQFTQKDGLVSDEVHGIQEDKAGNIYVETTVGVSKFDGITFTTLPVIDTDSTKHDWKLTPDDLWFRIGFDKAGPYRYDGENLYYLKFPPSPQEEVFQAQYPSTSFSPYGVPV